MRRKTLTTDDVRRTVLGLLLFAVAPALLAAWITFWLIRQLVSYLATTGERHDRT